MAHADFDLAETRRQECAAFRAMADLLLAHRGAWDHSLAARYSFMRFCDRVDILCGTGSYVALARVAPDPINWERHKADVLLRMVERMNALVDFIEDPRSTYPHAAHLLPSRSTLPMDDPGIVAFCREVHNSLLPVPGATTVRGGFASRMRNLNASLSIYADLDKDTSNAKEQPTIKGLDPYEQRRENCLHLLLVQLDVHMIKFAEHIAFQDGYHEARAVLMKLTVQARAAYFRKTSPWVVQSA
jgi:hypothetical protein